MMLGITSKGLMFVPNFVKNSELVQNLRGEHTHKEHLVSQAYLIFLKNESRIKMFPAAT
jgi:competence protein ComGC